MMTPPAAGTAAAAATAAAATSAAAGQTAERGTTGRPAAPSIWRQPEIRLVFAARVASVMGDWLYQIALVWLVLEVTGSTLALSAVAVAQIVPLLAVSALFSGRLVSVVTPSGLAALDLCQAAVVLSFPLLYWAGLLGVWSFVAVSIVVTILDSVCDPGLQAVVPQLTGRHGIPSVHSMLDLTKRLGRIAGPGLAAVLLLALPVAALFLVDAVSFAVSAACMLAAGRLTRTRHPTREHPPRCGIAPDRTGKCHVLPDGDGDGRRRMGRWWARRSDTRRAPAVSWRSTLAFLRREPVVLWLFTVRNTENLLWVVYLIGVPVLVQRAYHGGPWLWGALIASYAAGQLAGNAVATRRAGYRRVTRFVIAGWVLAGVGFAALGLTALGSAAQNSTAQSSTALGSTAMGSTDVDAGGTGTGLTLAAPVLGALCLLVSGAGSAAATVSADSYVGLAVPVPLQPAAFSWQFSGNQLTQLAGTVAFGALLTVAPAGQVVLASGLAMVAVAAAAGGVHRRNGLRQAAL
jgi:hypothetical protein